MNKIFLTKANTGKDFYIDWLKSPISQFEIGYYDMEVFSFMFKEWFDNDQSKLLVSIDNYIAWPVEEGFGIDFKERRSGVPWRGKWEFEPLSWARG